MEKIAVLSFFLPSNDRPSVNISSSQPSNAVNSSFLSQINIRDVQLWQNQSQGGKHAVGNNTLKGQFLQYVDLSQLPLWASPLAYQSFNELNNTVFTTSSTTLAYFSTKLRKPNRGIVVEIKSRDQDGWEYYILYDSIKDSTHYIRWLKFDLNKKNEIDKTLSNYMKSVTNENVDNNSSNTIGENNLDNFIKKRNISSNNMVKNDIIKKNIEKKDKKMLFDKTLTNLINSGLRLRNITSFEQSDFDQIFKMTFTSAEFALRYESKKFLLNSSRNEELPFDLMQDTIETLLTLFTRK